MVYKHPSIETMMWTSTNGLHEPLPALVEPLIGKLTFGNMTLELNIFHLNNKHKLVEDENQKAGEVCSVDQNAGKLNVQELQEIANQGEAGVLVLQSVATAGQLLSSELTSGKKIDHGKSNIKTIAQTTAGVEEILLLDPP